MRVLITGSAGQLGHDLIEILGVDHELYPFDLELDITDAAMVNKMVKQIKPEIIVNSAALTDVDGCESNIDAAYRVNAIGPHNLALAARAVSAAILTVSTDFIFDGRQARPYDEWDKANPLSVYGRSKWAGELAVREVCPDHYIVRTAWLFGKHGGNFVKTILRLAEEKEELSVVNDQTGSPTFSYDLAGRIAVLIKTGWYGTYHVTNSGSCSWHEFARTILAKAGSKTPVRPIPSADLARPAIRPANSVLRNYACDLRGLEPMRGYEEALDAFLA